MKVSVVVPTLRRPALLERCLNALEKQTLSGAEFEVLVCDDGDSGETAGLIVRLSRRFPAKLRWLAVSQAGSGRHGPAAARNAGWRHAHAPIIAFVDDDAIPDPHWLEEGLRKLSDPKLVAISGRVIVPHATSEDSGERALERIETAEFAGTNCFVRREVLQKVGGFDERFTSPWWEDADLHFSILEYVACRPGALRVGWCDRAVVTHPPRALDPRDYLSQERRALFSALLYKKHPSLYRQRVQALPPLRFYVQVLALLYALITALRGNYEMALLPLFAWLALTVDLASRHLRKARLPQLAWTSAILPFASVYWRLRGAVRFQVLFL